MANAIKSAAITAPLFGIHPEVVEFGFDPTIFRNAVAAWHGERYPEMAEWRKTRS